MTKTDKNHDDKPGQGATTPDHQREDQPLKELNDDPADKDDGSGDARKSQAS